MVALRFGAIRFIKGIALTSLYHLMTLPAALNKDLVMSGSIQLPHTCPHCQKVTAKTYQELEVKFGFRNQKQTVTKQSWCRVCRSTKE